MCLPIMLQMPRMSDTPTNVPDSERGFPTMEDTYARRRREELMIAMGLLQPRRGMFRNGMQQSRNARRDTLPQGQGPGFSEGPSEGGQSQGP